MSLNWNIEDVVNHEEVAVCHDSHGDNDHLTRNELTQSLITQAIVFRTIAIGISRITEGNAEEFYIRGNMWESNNGTILHIAGEDYSLTLEDITRRIGLRTNASTLTNTQFDKHRSDELRIIAKYALRDEKRQAAKEEKAAA